MGYGLLNLGSLLFGLIAWILPVINLLKRKINALFSFASISACAVALYMQIIYQNYLARKEDWSAIMDTSGGLVLVSSVLLAITLVLNVIVLLKNKRNG